MNSRKKHPMQLLEKYRCNGLFLNYLSLCIFNRMMMMALPTAKTRGKQ
jgi:hypothetical protein